MSQEPPGKPIFKQEEIPELVPTDDENIVIDKVQKTPFGPIYARIKNKPKPKPPVIATHITSGLSTFPIRNWSGPTEITSTNFWYSDKPDYKYTKDELKNLAMEAIKMPYTPQRGKKLFNDDNFPNNFFIDCTKCGHHINKLRDFFDHGIIEHSIDPRQVVKIFYQMIDQIDDKEKID